MIPRKNSRGIVVDGASYRWVVRRRPTYSQYLDAPMTWAVSSGEGAVLAVTSAYARPDSAYGWPSGVVTPGRVAGVIRAALAAGWKPGKAGPAFKWREAV